LPEDIELTLAPAFFLASNALFMLFHSHRNGARGDLRSGLPKPGVAPSFPLVRPLLRPARMQL
jgi:hypothetical protein